MARKKTTEELNTALDFSNNITEAGLDFEGLSVGNINVPQIGIQVPSFGWELLLGNTVLPFGFIYSLSAPAGSGKSTLSWEIGTWFMKQDGWVSIIENENKLLRDLAASVIRAKKLSESQFKVSTADSFDALQHLGMTSCKIEEEFCKKKKNKDYPLLTVFDSVTGNDTEQAQIKVVSEHGVAQQSFSNVAWASTKFLQTYPAMVSKLPMVVLAIRHVSEQLNGTGQYAQKIYSSKGGKAWDYRSKGTFLLTNSVSEGKAFSSTENYKRHFCSSYKLRLTKGKYENFRLPYKVRWFNDNYVDQTSGELRANQLTLFAWHESSLMVLRTPSEYKLPTHVIEAIRDTISVIDTDPPDNTSSMFRYYYAKELGMTKADAVPPKQFMDALYADTKLISALRANCGIEIGIPFVLGDKYSALKEQAIAMAKTQAETVSQLDSEVLTSFEG